MIKAIQEKKVMAIERAQMRLQITAPKEGRKLKEKLAKLWSSMETEDWDGGTMVLVRKQPLIILEKAYNCLFVRFALLILASTAKLTN